MEKYVKIDRKVLFEICDAILEHEGYCDRDDCYDSEYPLCPSVGREIPQESRKHSQ